MATGQDHFFRLQDLCPIAATAFNAAKKALVALCPAIGLTTTRLLFGASDFGEFLDFFITTP